MATAMGDDHTADSTEPEESLPTRNAPVDYRTQLSQLKRIINMTELKEGTSWFLLDTHWFKQWKRYVGYDSWEQTNAGQESANPGPIDNKSLFKDDSCNDLKIGMIDELDYHLLPSDAWEKLSTWYGVVDGQQAVERKVISQGLYVKHLKVEVYLTDVKLSLFTAQDEVAVKKFSKAEKLENVVQVMKQLFEVQDGLDVRLWSKYMSTSYESLDKLDVTLQDSSIYTGQGLVLEVRNEDGSWPREKSESQFRNSSSSSVGSGSSSSRTQSYGWYSSYSSSSYSSTTDPGLTGLNNLGNTCFMNSALQCLSNTPPLTQYFLEKRHEQEINRSNPLGMKGRIAEAYGGLLLDMWGGSCVASPRTFKAEVGRFAPQFVGYQQHDSQELLAFLLDGLHEDLNRVKSKPYIELKDSNGRPDQEVAIEAWQNHRRRNDSVIVDLIQGQYKSTVVCPTCKRFSVTFDPFMYLTLPLPVKKTRRIELVLVRSDPMIPPMLYRLTVPKIGTISDVAKELARQTGLDHRKLLFADVYSCRLHKIFSSRDAIQTIYDRDEVYAYEIPVERDDPEFILLRIYHRERRTRAVNSFHSGSYNYTSSTLFGWPFVVAVSREKITYKELYRQLISQMRRFVQCPNRAIEGEAVDNRECEEHPPARRRLLDIANASDNQEQEGVEMEDVSNNVGGSDGTLDNQILDKNHPAVTDNDVERNGPSDNNEDGAVAGARGDDQNQMQTEDSPQGSSSEQQGVDKNRPAAAVEDVNVVVGEHIPKLFTMTVVNSYGSSELRQLEDNDDRPIQFKDPSYVALDWDSDMKFDCIDTTAFKLLEKDDSCWAIADNQPKEVNLHDCIELFTSTETLSEEDPWYCSKCKDFKQADKTMTLWQLPEVLVVHLKRFSYDRYWRDKLDTFVKFPVDGLDMSPYVVNPDDTTCKTYDLCAISNHYGGLGGGHYTAYCKNKDTGKWYHFDDSSVSEMQSDDRLVSKAAYVLVYLRHDVSKVVIREPSNGEFDDEMDEKQDDSEKSGEVEAQHGNSSEPDNIEMKDENGDNGND